MRRAVLILALAALAAAGFGGTYYFLRSPHWSLYQMGKAIHDRNPGLFVTYVDVGRILSNQKDDIVELLLPEQNRRDQRDLLRSLITAFMAPLTEQVNQQVIRIISDKERQNLPTAWTLVWAAQVSRNSDAALVVLADGQAGRRLRLGMQRDEQGVWRVVEINAQDLRALFKEYLQNRPRAQAPATSQTAPAN